jgi:putative peptidoglycan lipid II flippase
VAKDWGSFQATLSRGIRLTAAILLPATIGYLILAGPIVDLLLAHGVVSPNSNSTALLTRTMVMFVLGLVPFSTFQLLLRAFYAIQNTRTTFLVNIASVGTNVVANLLLFWLLPEPWKVPGLALGSSIAYSVGSVLIMGVATALVAGLVDAIAGDGTLGSLLTVAAGVAVGLATYLLAARLLRIGELGLVLNLVRRRAGRSA